MNAPLGHDLREEAGAFHSGARWLAAFVACLVVLTVACAF
jgi:hypothetical protein